MSDNSFGHLFRVTTWGESHGPAIGCVVDGTPPGISLTEADIQGFLDARRPGQNRFVTQRREPDKVKILSGVFEDRTTGTPILLQIDNVDQRSKDYSDIKDRFRPGHADYTYTIKYGARDYRGGGRSSARETASRVAGGAIARKILGQDVQLRGCLVQLGPYKAPDDARDWQFAQSNPLWCPDPELLTPWMTYLDDLRKSGDSVGAVIEIQASGVPAGFGAPVYGKLDSDLASAMMSINAVKGVEVGAGFGAAAMRGSAHADEMYRTNTGPGFRSNNAGGILGGISTGQDIVVRFAVKPTSSILQPRDTITRDGKDTSVQTRGRHDPCVGLRAVPVGEAMMAIVLADHMLRDRGQTGMDRRKSSPTEFNL